MSQQKQELEQAKAVIKMLADALEAEHAIIEVVTFGTAYRQPDSYMAAYEKGEAALAAVKELSHD